MFFVIDIEATCCEKRKIKDNNEIIELGIVACDIYGDFLSGYQSFVKPVINTRLSKFCKKLTGIKQEWVDSAETLDITIKSIDKWFVNHFKGKMTDIPWMTFGSWDRLCLRNDCNRHDIVMPFGRYIDLKKFYVEKRGCSYCGLREFLEREGEKFEGESHRAMTDALNARKLAKKFPQEILNFNCLD